MFRKVLVANRGEIACRVIRACREMGIATVAVYSKADEKSLHRLIADEAICVGAGSNSESYLNLGNVLMATQMSGADAVHPGYGYFSERASFAQALQSVGAKFVGPPVSAIQAMGDKAAAKKAAKAAGCPVVPGSDGPVADETSALRAAQKIGFPVLLKAVAGGGGRGIRRIDNAEELPSQFRTAAAEAKASFGNGDLIVERCVVDPRHVEIQVLGDEHGNVVHLGERECSVQNLRHQKILEEAPHAGLTERLRKRMGDAAVQVAKQVGYTNAGTVEFLLDSSGKFFFLEMNTRLQVEHPVTEAVTGVDLVKQMLAVAAGEALPFRQKDIRIQGHSIEARITAQDPEKDFVPSTGRIDVWRQPGGNGIRVDTHCYGGFEVSPYYDPMIAKLIVWGRDRKEALAKLRSALREYHVEGITTNIPFLRKLVEHPLYQEGRVDTSFVARVLGETDHGG